MSDLSEFSNYFPLPGAFFRELEEDDILIGMLVFVFLTAGLHEVGISCHAASGFVGVGLCSGHFQYLVRSKFFFKSNKKKSNIS